MIIRYFDHPEDRVTVRHVLGYRAPSESVKYKKGVTNFDSDPFARHAFTMYYDVVGQFEPQEIVLGRVTKSVVVLTDDGAFLASITFDGTQVLVEESDSFG